MQLSISAIINLILYVTFSLFCIHEIRSRKRKYRDIAMNYLSTSSANNNNSSSNNPSSVIPPELLDEIDSFPYRILFATLLRITWLAFELGGLWQESFHGCEDKHVIVETIGRLGQLAFFSSFLGVLTVWWELVRADDVFFPTPTVTSAATTTTTTSSPTTIITPDNNTVTNDLDSSSPTQQQQQQQQQSYNHHHQQRIQTTSSVISVQTALERSTARRNGFFTITDDIIMAQTSESILCSPSTIQVLFNFWVWIIALGLFVFKYESCAHSSTVSNAQTICIAIASGILGIMFIVIGVRLYRKLGQREIPGRKRLQRKIFWVSLICFISFGLFRCILFLIQPLTGYYFTGILGNILYPWFFYTVPELIPSFVMLWFTRRHTMTMENELNTMREQVRMIPTERTALLSNATAATTANNNI
jgi:hypothetical protein